MQTKITGKQMRVASLGLDQRFINSLQVFFDRQCNDLCVFADSDTDFAIVDLDVFGSKDLLVQYQNENQGHPLVVLSLKEIKTEIDKGIISLRKPFKMEQLYNAFQKINELLETQQVKVKKNAPKIPLSFDGNSKQKKVLPKIESRKQSVSKNLKGRMAVENNLSQEKPELRREKHETKTDKKSSDNNLDDASINVSRSTAFGKVAPQTDNDIYPAALPFAHQSEEIFIGSAPDISIEDTAQIAKAQYNPENFLQGQLLRACELSRQKGKGMILETRDDSFIIMSEHDLVQTVISENHLRALSSVPVNSGNFSIKSLGKRQAAQLNGSPQLSLESVLWKSALYAARGRVPTGTDLTTPVFLKHWPNLTRVTLFPHALRIAALWAGRPYSLLESAQLLGIPQRYVFSFYSAVSVLDLVQTDHSTGLDARTPVKKAGKRSLLGRIIKHLRNNY